MTTTEKVIGGVIVLGAIGGLIYITKKDDKKAERNALIEVAGEKIAVPDQTSEAQKDTIVAIKEQKSMFVAKPIEPLVLPSKSSFWTKMNEAKVQAFTPVGSGYASQGLNDSLKLQKGSKGREVEALQRILGFGDKGTMYKLRAGAPTLPTIDGDFGQKTEDALFKRYGVKYIYLSQISYYEGQLRQSKFY